MVPAAASCRLLYHQLRRWARQSHGITGPDICATLPGGVNVVFRISNCFCKKGLACRKGDRARRRPALCGSSSFYRAIVLLVELDPRAASRGGATPRDRQPDAAGRRARAEERGRAGRYRQRAHGVHRCRAVLTLPQRTIDQSAAGGAQWRYRG
jgi:hypothetical protein